MRTVPCKACGRPIAFVRTRRGKFLPVDPEPVLAVMRGAGMKVIVTAEGEVIKGFEPRDPTKPGVERGLVAHWSTCTDPDRFRRTRRA